MRSALVGGMNNKLTAENIQAWLEAGNAAGYINIRGLEVEGKAADGEWVQLGWLDQLPSLLSYLNARPSRTQW